MPHSEPYAPIRRQVLNLLRTVNRVRKQDGFEPVPTSCLRLKRRVYRPLGASLAPRRFDRPDDTAPLCIVVFSSLPPVPRKATEVKELCRRFVRVVDRCCRRPIGVTLVGLMHGSRRSSRRPKTLRPGLSLASSAGGLKQLPLPGRRTLTTISRTKADRRRPSLLLSRACRSTATHLVRRAKLRSRRVFSAAAWRHSSDLRKPNNCY